MLRTDDTPVTVEEFCRDLAQTYGPIIKRYMASRGVRDPEDPTQEVLAAAVAQADRLAKLSHSELESWIFTVAYRRVADAHRRRYRRRHVPIDLRSTVEPGPGPPTEVCRTETQRVVRQALTQLDQREQAIIRLRVLEGRPARDVAEVLDMTPSHVRVTQARALSKLKGLLPPPSYLEMRGRFGWIWALSVKFMAPGNRVKAAVSKAGLGLPASGAACTGIIVGSAAALVVTTAAFASSAPSAGPSPLAAEASLSHQPEAPTSLDDGVDSDTSEPGVATPDPDRPSPQDAEPDGRPSEGPADPSEPNPQGGLTPGPTDGGANTVGAAVAMDGDGVTTAAGIDLGAVQAEVEASVTGDGLAAGAEVAVGEVMEADVTAEVSGDGVDAAVETGVGSTDLGANVAVDDESTAAEVAIDEVASVDVTTTTEGVGITIDLGGSQQGVSPGGDGGDVPAEDDEGQGPIFGSLVAH